MEGRTEAGSLQCTATSKRSDRRCKRAPTAGYAVCRSHGANPSNPGGAPLGNKHALVTGQYEAIWLDQLEADERALYARIDSDALAQLAEEIRLTTIRERRMLARILLLSPHEYTVVERSVTEEQATEDVFPRTSPGEAADPVPVEKTRTVHTVKHEGTLGQIQRIEEALTRVQERKAKLIELAHRLSASADDGSLAELTRAIAESRRLIAARAS